MPAWIAGIQVRLAGCVLRHPCQPWIPALHAEMTQSRVFSGAAALNPSRSNLHRPSPQVLGEKISYERPVPKRHVVTHVVAAFE